MIARHYSEVDNVDVEVEGAVGVTKRILAGDAEGAPNFAMRYFTVEPGGKTPFHTHDWEHEVFVVSGTGRIDLGGGSIDIRAGSSALILPGEEHGFLNTGTEDLEFICVIPLLS